MTSNPYIGRGAPVSGERLVGRSQTIEKLVERLLCEAHCSIVGLPRLGKTSIAKEAMCLCNARSEIVSTGYITLDAISGPVQAYTRILDEIVDDVDEINRAQVYSRSHDEAYDMFLRILRRRRKSGHKGIIVIDEMDGIAREDFVDAHLFVSRLREIANERGKYGLTFVFISRRSLDMIQGAVDCSTLAGLCEVFYLQPLDFDGFEHIVKRSPIPVSQTGVDQLWRFTGGHPFLTEVVMCEAVENATEEITNETIEDAQHRQAYEFTNQYRNIQNMLSHEGMFESLCELTVGPRWRNIDIHVVSLIKQYGLVHDSSTDGLVCMSDHFKNFLSQISRMTPTWFLLGDVEKHLRSLVDCVMLDVYGSDWAAKVQAKHPQLKDKEGIHLIERLSIQKSREKRQFGDAASDLLLDYAYIGDLKDLIFAEWERYRGIFSGAKNDWEKRFQDVMKVRNPMAHNRPVPTEIIQDAEKSCQVFLGQLRSSGASM